MSRLPSLTRLVASRFVLSSNGLSRGTSCFSALKLVSEPVASPIYFATRRCSTKGDKDLSNFLDEEIETEKRNVRALEMPAQGFEVKQDEAELTFTKMVGSEKIVVTLNVNHTVDSADPDDGTAEAPEMKSRPSFEVDIIKNGGRTLSFSCSYVTPTDQVDGQAPQEDYDDVFTIDEVTIFKGEDWTEKKYAVAGDILDGYLYDLMMNMLDERGINREFAERLSAYCSAYEHSLYINLLEDINKFVK